MPTFDNNESLASIRTKINDAITMTEGHDTSKMPTAPDDGQQYVGKGSNWEVFTLPTKTLKEQMDDDPNCEFYFYPNKFSMAWLAKTGASIVWAGNITEHIKDGVVLTPKLGTGTLSTNITYSGIRPNSQGYKLSAFVVFYYDPTEPLVTSVFKAFDGGNSGTLGFVAGADDLVLYASYIATTQGWEITTSNSVDKVVLNTLSVGWHYGIINVEHDGVNSVTLSFSVDGGTPAVNSGSYNSTLTAITGSKDLDTNNTTNIALYARYLNKNLTEAEALEMFNQFKADNGIV